MVNAVSAMTAQRCESESSSLRADHHFVAITIHRTRSIVCAPFIKTCEAKGLLEGAIIVHDGTIRAPGTTTAFTASDTKVTNMSITSFAGGMPLSRAVATFSLLRLVVHGTGLLLPPWQRLRRRGRGCVHPPALVHVRHGGFG